MSVPRQNHIAVARPSKVATNSMFGPAPVLESEDSNAYNQLLERVSASVKPADIIEDIWVRDFVDLSWEIARYQSYRSLALKAAIPKALEEVLAPFVNGPWKYGALNVYEHGALRPTASMEIANDWVSSDPNAIEQVDELLAEANLTMRDVEARALTLVIDKIERIDRLVSQMTARRSALLRDIERRKAAFADMLRRSGRELNGDCEQVNIQGAAKG